MRSTATLGRNRPENTKFKLFLIKLFCMTFLRPSGYNETVNNKLGGYGNTFLFYLFKERYLVGLCQSVYLTGVDISA